MTFNFKIPKIAYCVTSVALVLLLSFINPLSVSAAENGTFWDGVISVDAPTQILLPSATVSHDFNTTAPVDNLSVVYSGKQNLIVNIDSQDSSVGKYINGWVNKRITVSADALNGGKNFLKFINVSADPVIMDGVFISIIKNQELTTTQEFVYELFINFDNYFVSDTNIFLPLLVEITANCYYPYNQATQWYAQGLATSVVLEDYAGDVMQYDSLIDVPSMDGFLADQNQQIIDNSQTQITVTQQQTEQQHADSQAQIDATNNQTNTLVNGYDSSAGSDVKSQFDSVASDLNNAEASLFDAFAYDGVNYDPFSDYLNSQAVKDVFSFVSSLMSSIWNALGDFSIPIYLGLLIVVVTRFLGYQQMSSGGGD